MCGELEQITLAEMKNLCLGVVRKLDSVGVNFRYS